ncbi:divalent cation tolerance protein [Polaromonas sp. OV174]|nr:divalent cation tolerance protein [Polaromonas sp. OV174]
MAANDGMNQTSPFCLVLTSAASEEQADTLARLIVEARLGACVQIQPIKSIYRWQGAVCAEPEWQLAIKTRQARFAALERFIRQHHSYETPEIVQLAISAGSADYLRWLDQGTRDEPAP